MEYRFIVNSKAAAGKSVRIFEKIRPSLDSLGFNYEVHSPASKEELTELVRNHNNENTALISVGGDGTANTILNAVYPEVNFTFGIIPAGSGNDAVKNNGIPKNPEAAVKAVAAGKTKEIDLGEIEIINETGLNRKYCFINSFGCGFDAFVANLNNKSRILPGLAGYLLSVFRSLRHYEAFNLISNYDNGSINGRTLLLAIGNGKYSGGGFLLTPGAINNDGELEVCHIQDIPVSKILTSLPKALTGSHIKLPEVRVLKSKRGELLFSEPVFYQIDGECNEVMVSKIMFKVSDKKLKIIT